MTTSTKDNSVKMDTATLVEAIDLLTNSILLIIDMRKEERVHLFSVIMITVHLQMDLVG